MRRFIEQHQGRVDDKIDASSVIDEKGKRVLDGQKFVELIVTDEESGMTDARSLLENHRYFRADYIRRYLNALKSETPIDIGRRLKASSRAANLVSDSESQRREALTSRAELGKRALGGMLTPIDKYLIIHKTVSKIRQVGDD